MVSDVDQIPKKHGDESRIEKVLLELKLHNQFSVLSASRDNESFQDIMFLQIILFYIFIITIIINTIIIITIIIIIIECLQPDRGGCELIDSHGAGTVVCPFTTGRWVGTETCGMDNVFPPDDLYFGLDTYNNLYDCICITVYLVPWYRTKHVIMCLLMGTGMTCGGRPFSGTGCPIPDVEDLCLLCIDLCLGCCFYFNHLPRLGCFCPWTLLFE